MTTKIEFGKRYVVTKASDDRTFQVGDHVHVEEDGSVVCREALGWIIPSEAQEAIKGMEVREITSRPLTKPENG
jgi:urease beta subunit